MLGFIGCIIEGWLERFIFSPKLKNLRHACADTTALDRAFFRHCRASGNPDCPFLDIFSMPLDARLRGHDGCRPHLIPSFPRQRESRLPVSRHFLDAPGCPLKIRGYDEFSLFSPVKICREERRIHEQSSSWVARKIHIFTQTKKYTSLWRKP
jgi:hypothetical protein